MLNCGDLENCKMREKPKICQFSLISWCDQTTRPIPFFFIPFHSIGVPPPWDIRERFYSYDQCE